MRYDVDVAKKLDNDLTSITLELSEYYINKVLGTAVNNGGNWQDVKQKEFCNSVDDMTDDILETIKEIRYYGKKVGIALKPKTNVKEIYEYLKYIDLALIMTVEPGFGGQKFMPDQLEKAVFIKNMSKNPNLLIEIDGGVNFETINLAKRYPIDICVSGTCVFKSQNAEETIVNLKQKGLF